MAENMIVYKCPGCGADVKLSADTEEMKCPFCDELLNGESSEEFSMDEVQTEIPGMINGSLIEDWLPEEKELYSVYECSECHAQTISAGAANGVKCPFCSGAMCKKESLGDISRPRYIIPFATTKGVANAAFDSMIAEMSLVPSSFKKRNRPENIFGVYVPAKVIATDCMGNVSFNAQNIKEWIEGDRKYRMTSTYAVFRDGSVSFENIAMFDTARIDDKLMDSIEPFELAGSVAFDKLFTEGFQVALNELDMNLLEEKAREKVSRLAIEAFRARAGMYNSLTVNQANMNVVTRGVKDVLMPVWVMNNKYLGKNYLFVVNGRTGKAAGDVPVAWVKLAMILLSVFGVTMLVLLAILGIL